MQRLTKTLSVPTVAQTYAGETHSWECDFVTSTEAIQVCATLDAQNQEREVRGALQGAALPGKRRPVIITLDQRGRLSIDGTTVEVVPAWEWLLANAAPARRSR